MSITLGPYSTMETGLTTAPCDLKNQKLCTMKDLTNFSEEMKSEMKNKQK